MTTQSIVKKEEKSISVHDPEIVKQAKSMSGEYQGVSIPFIPILEINNRPERKKAVIDGVEQTVKLDPKKGWNQIIKKDNEYENGFWGEDLKGVILRDRFQVKSKYKKTEIPFKTDEFDNWSQNIIIYDLNNRKNVLFEGTYREMRSQFTAMNDKGEQEKLYDLFVVLYVNVEASGQIFRVKIKMTQDNQWFAYKEEFGENDTYVGYLTNFNLVKKQVGDIVYWAVDFKKGDPVDLKEQISLQKEIQRFFKTADVIAKKNNVQEEKIIPIDEEIQQVDDDKIIDSEIDNIPF